MHFGYILGNWDDCGGPSSVASYLSIARKGAFFCWCECVWVTQSGVCGLPYDLQFSRCKDIYSSEWQGVTGEDGWSEFYGTDAFLIRHSCSIRHAHTSVFFLAASSVIIKDLLTLGVTGSRCIGFTQGCLCKVRDRSRWLFNERARLVLVNGNLWWEEGNAGSRSLICVWRWEQSVHNWYKNVTSMYPSDYYSQEGSVFSWFEWHSFPCFYRRIHFGLSQLGNFTRSRNLSAH